MNLLPPLTCEVVVTRESIDHYHTMFSGGLTLCFDQVLPMK